MTPRQKIRSLIVLNPNARVVEPVELAAYTIEVEYFRKDGRALPVINMRGVHVIPDVYDPKLKSGTHTGKLLSSMSETTMDGLYFELDQAE